MRVIVFLCLLGAAVPDTPTPGPDTPTPGPDTPTPGPDTPAPGTYSWGGPADGRRAHPAENACLTDQSSCGCCLMQRKISRMENFFNSSLSEVQVRLEKAQNALDNIRASRSAFSLALTDTRMCVGPYRDVMHVHYNVVFLNLGGGYDPSTGVYTAPLSGVYSLSVTVYSDAGAPAASLSACVSLTVNGVQVARPSEMNQQDQEDSSTTMLAVQLRAGDKVAVYLPIGCFLCDNENHYNTFSGFLLYPTN